MTKLPLAHMVQYMESQFVSKLSMQVPPAPVPRGQDARLDRLANVFINVVVDEVNPA
jgi:hypothetical protein